MFMFTETIINTRMLYFSVSAFEKQKQQQLIRRGEEPDDSQDMDTFTFGSVDSLLRGGSDISMTNTTGDTVLHLATAVGHVGLLTRLVECGGGVNDVNKRGESCVFRARNRHVLEYLLSKRARLDLENADGDTVLHEYASVGDISCEQMIMVIDNGTVVDCRNKRLETAIFRACANGSWTKVCALMEAGASRDLLNSDGRSILHVALASKHGELARFLIAQADVNLNVGDNTGTTALHMAVANDDLETTKLLLSSGVAINAHNVTGQSATAMAAASRNADILRLLLENGGVLGGTDAYPLLTFAHTGDADMVRVLIAQETKLNERDTDGRSALHLAVRGQHWDVVRLIVDAGASSETRDSEGSTPLHDACELCRDDDVIERLISSGAPLNQVNLRGRTPLHTAVLHNSANAVRPLVENGSDVSAQDRDGFTPLMLAVASPADTWDLEAKCELMVLSSAVNMQNKDRRTALHYVAVSGLVSLAKLLISHNCSIDLTDKHERTPLHYACAGGFSKMAALLIEHGACAERQDADGQSAVYHAVTSGNVDTLDLVIAHGANPDKQRTDGGSPLHQALHDQSLEIVELLLMSDVKVNVTDSENEAPLHIAAAMSPLHVVSTLLRLGADVNVSNRRGRTPLHASIENPNSEVTKLLVASGGELDARDCDCNTTLHLAVKSGSYDHVNVLLTSGADIDATNKAGDSSLHLAAASKETDVLELLIADEADMNLQNSRGESPLLVALIHSNIEAASILLDQGASVAVADNDGETALHKAVRMRNARSSFLLNLVQRGLSVDCKNKHGATPLDTVKGVSKQIKLDLLQALGIES